MERWLRSDASVMAFVDPLSMFGLEEELTCSICLCVFQTPVTTPCGHNFCLPCLEMTWMEAKDKFSCPQCRASFESRPELKKNTVLCKVVEQFQISQDGLFKGTSGEKEKAKADSSPAKPRSPSPVPCDSCLVVDAAKTCLTCMASFCQEHLGPHLESPAFKSHQLVPPVNELQQKKCEAHSKLLEFFCKEHGVSICCFCLLSHKTCSTTPLREAKGAKELHRFQEEEYRKAALESDVLRLRSVTPPSNYACSQTVLREALEFKTLGARPKFSQPEEHFYSHTERETDHSPRSLKQAIKGYRDQIEICERELSQAKMALSMLEPDKRDSPVFQISEKAILAPSPKPKTHTLEDIVSGKSEQRAVYTSQFPRDLLCSPIAHATQAEMLQPKNVTAAPSPGRNNLLQRADMHVKIQEHFQTLQQTLSNMSLDYSDIQAAMQQVPPQAQFSAPPGGSGAFLDGAQQYSMQQRQMAAPPTSQVNIAAQAPAPAVVQQPQVRLQRPQVQQQAFLPAQQAFQMHIPQQAFSVAPLTGESKLKMSGQNYKAWVSEVALLLCREGTHCMVFNPPVQPWTPAIRDLETKACTTLLMSMDTELQVTFSPDATAQEIWVQLENCYRPVSIEYSCLLMSEFHGSRLKPGEQIGGHLTKLKGMRNELRERGHFIDDIQMISIIINSLNYEWKDAIAKINHVPIAQRTVNNVCRLLIEEEALMLAMPHLRRPPASRAPARRPFRGRAYVPRMPRCYICNRVGHATQDCLQRVPAPVTYQPRGTDSGGRSRGRRQRRRGPRRDPQVPLATLALINDPQPHPEYDRQLLWTLDSGAALHVTYRKEFFTEMHEPEPELRELYSFSNHSCKVMGKGTVYVEELDAFIPDVYYIPTANSNLLSQSHLSRVLKFQVHHLEKASYIVKNGDIVAETMLIGGVYYIKPKPKPQTQASIQTPKEEGPGPERDVPVRDPVATPKAPKANKKKIRKQVTQSKPEVPHKTVNGENSLIGKPLHARCIHKWHRRLGHASFRVLRKMPEFAKGLF